MGKAKRKAKAKAKATKAKTRRLRVRVERVDSAGNAPVWRAFAGSTFLGHVSGPRASAMRQARAAAMRQL